MIVVLLSNFKKGSLSKSIIIYGGFSSLALSVNMYLGLRFLYDRGDLYIRNLKKFSFYCYILACTFNWSWQSMYIILAYRGIYNNPLIIVKLILNSAMLYSWIKDDIILMRHLKN